MDELVDAAGPDEVAVQRAWQTLVAQLASIGMRSRPYLFALLWVCWMLS
jgi:hypothetical protein